MMQAYYYTPNDCDLDELPDGAFRLDDSRIAETADPKQADLFVCPVMIHHMGQMTGYGTNNLAKLKRLPYLDKHPGRHVFFNCGDTFRTALPVESLAFRCDATKQLLAVNPNTVPIAWPTKDCRIDSGGRAFEWGERRFDVSFIGWERLALCTKALDSCERSGLVCLVCDFERKDTFYGHHEKQDIANGAPERTRYLESINRSRFSLCPTSIEDGVIRYRVYEALSAGTIPVVIGDGSVLPMSELIDWDRCALIIPEADVDNTDGYIREAIDCNWFGQAERQYAIDVWNTLLTSDNWFNYCTDKAIEWVKREQSK